MKRLAVAICLLSLFGLFQIALAQEQRRYVVPYVQSLRTGGTIHSATVITVFNNSPGPCSIQVDWFQSGGAAECARDVPVLPSHQSAHFCTRALPNNISSCLSQTTCASTDFNVLQGFAIISSSAGLPCSAIAADVRVIYSNADDSVIQGVSNPRVIFVDEGNLGD
jgi:hypothetical protein